MNGLRINSHLYPPILEDFSTFLHYFADKKVKLTAAGYLSGKICAELNGKMSIAQEGVTNRSRHYQIRPIFLFYFLALNGKLLTKKSKGKSTFILADLDRFELFFDLTDTEQYICLLEILWVHSDWVQLGGPDGRRSSANSIHYLLKAISRMDKGLAVQKKGLDRELIRSLNWDLWPFSEYFRLLGFWDATFEPYDLRYMLRMVECYPSRLGIELAKVFISDRKIDIWNKWESFDDEMFFFFMDAQPEITQEEYDQAVTVKESEAFLKAFQHLFPKGELVNSLPFPKPVFRRGNHIFRVSFKYEPDIWRLIAMPAKTSLHDLHLAIQHAIDFDDDHLYAFYPDNNRYSRLSFNAPYEGMDGPYTDEVRIGDFQIEELQPFLYFFDFGDSWEFEVVLEEIDDNSPELKKWKVIDSHGKAPKQYDYYEEDEWYE